MGKRDDQISQTRSIFAVPIKISLYWLLFDVVPAYNFLKCLFAQFTNTNLFYLNYFL